MNRRKFVGSAVAAGAAARFLGAVSATASPRGATRQSRIIVDGLDTSVLNEEFLGMLQDTHIDCVHFSMGDLPSFGMMFEFFDAHADAIGLATTVREIRQAKLDGRIAVVFGQQECNWLEELFEKTATGTYAPLAALRAKYQLGLRILGIAYNATNMFGAGNLDDHIGLTRAGRRLVDEIHRLGIILDVGGHLGEQTSLDAIEMSFGVPVICSHTNMASLNDNLRAISDRVAVAIARTGGVIGLTAISDFHTRNPNNAAEHGKVSPQATLDMHLDQYEYLRDLVGIDHVGMGPDFVWGWGDDFNHVAEVSVTFPPEALSDGAIQLVKGFEDISKLPNLIRGFEQRGWPQDHIDKVLGQNWLRVYEQVWGA